MPTTLNISPNLQLETDRVQLRILQAADVEHLLPFALQEPEIWTYSLISGAGAEGIQNYVTTALANYALGQELPFIVFNKQTNTYAGSTRFYDIQPQQHTLQLGYTWYGKQHRGTGINTHCKYLLLRYAFETLNMQRVEFRADADNARSIQAMLKIGCVKEGVLRSNTYKTDGSRRNSIVLSILKHEWEATVSAGLIAAMHK